MTASQVTKGLSPYAEYRDSGVPWLGLIPSHWSSTRIKAYLRELDERKGDREETLLSLTRAKGLIAQSEASSRMSTAADFSNYKICGPGNIVMNRMQAWSGMFAASTLAGVVSPDYSVFECSPAADVKLLEYLFKSPLYVEQFARRSKGIGSGFNRLYGPDFGAIEMALPPLEEQRVIARFLDRQDRRINRFIRAKQRLINLLNEQKRAIIHQAVTRGLDPSVPLKPSGIDWLGDIPAHWQLTRLKFEATHIVDCLHATPDYIEESPFMAVRTADIEPGKLRTNSIRRVSEEQFALWTARLVPREGDILYSREGERFGIAAPVPANATLCISQRMTIFRIREEQSSDYIMWQLNCSHVYNQASADTIGATSPHVNIERIKNFELVLPPLVEQCNIVSHVEEQTRELEALVTRAHHEINLIREYRTRLIADVVTGKLDVRNHPDSREGPQEAIDELDDRLDIEGDPEAVHDEAMDDAFAS